MRIETVIETDNGFLVQVQTATTLVGAYLVKCEAMAFCARSTIKKRSFDNNLLRYSTFFFFILRMFSVTVPLLVPHFIEDTKLLPYRLST